MCAAVGSMPIEVAALATVPFSAIARVAACCTNPMQHACAETLVKSAPLLNATPMPSLVSTSFSDSLEAILTLGSATSVSVLLAARPEASAPAVAASGTWQPVPPAGGSAASMLSLPPLYGSATAVQPCVRVTENAPPRMKLAVTGPPAARKLPLAVSAWLNGSFHLG